MVELEVVQERSVLDGGAALITLKGVAAGPTLALLGGVHGDEDEGVLAVCRIVQELTSLPFVGTVRAVAPANPAAWSSGSRTSPLDDGNLARSFPGAGNEGPTPALAAGITASVIDGADVLIDLHSAGLNYRMPLFCGFTRASVVADDSERAALAFGAPLIWAHAESPSGRSLSVAGERGIPAVYAECSGGGSIRRDELDAYVAGVLSVMAEFGMLPSPGRRRVPDPARWVYDGGGDLDSGTQSEHDGLFVSSTSAGAVVAAGEEIGRIYDYQGALLHVVRASDEGMVMFLRRRARVRAGDVIFSLARLNAGKA